MVDVSAVHRASSDSSSSLLICIFCTRDTRTARSHRLATRRDLSLDRSESFSTRSASVSSSSVLQKVEYLETSFRSFCTSARPASSNPPPRSRLPASACDTLWDMFTCSSRMLVFASKVWLSVLNMVRCHRFATRTTRSFSVTPCGEELIGSPSASPPGLSEPLPSLSELAGLPTERPLAWRATSPLLAVLAPLPPGERLDCMLRMVLRMALRLFSRTASLCTSSSLAAISCCCSCMRIIWSSRSPPSCCLSFSISCRYCLSSCTLALDSFFFTEFLMRLVNEAKRSVLLVSSACTRAALMLQMAAV
mmetsp:Transcript_47726/g.91211  ORF Transcript_47726/g.91211 Transcript_47726/m.91211 type:complete len:307 (-) Transcript_47726:1670-2590(-)